MIQDISPYKFHNEYRPEAVPSKTSPLLCFNRRKLLIDSEALSGNDLSRPFPSYGMFEDKPSVVYAFAVDDIEFFLLTGDALPEKSPDMENFEYVDIRQLRRSATNVFGLISFTGVHLYEWYRDSRYCGRCGGVNVHSLHERAMHCPVCDRNIYPRIMPAVIVGVICDGRILVTKYREGYGYYALVAGFAEIGETLEETVKREVMEETGLKVKNITYYNSQPWGIANDLLVGYFCEVFGNSEIHIDENELKLAEWKSPAELTLQPDSYSLTNDMMKYFKEHGRGNFSYEDHQS